MKKILTALVLAIIAGEVRAYDFNSDTAVADLQMMAASDIKSSAKENSTAIKAEAVNWDELADKTAIKTDLYFCVKMANGERLSAGTDGTIQKVLGCEKVIDKALNLGLSEKEIKETIQKAISDMKWSLISQKAAVEADLYLCVKMSNGNNIPNGLGGPAWKGLGCDNIMDKARQLGFSEGEIMETVQRALENR